MEARLENTITEPRKLSKDRLVNDFKAVFQRAEEKTVERAKAADRTVRGHPYQSIGVALGLGILIGVLLRRK